VNSVAWQGNGRRLATCSSDSTVRLWDTTTGLEEFTFHGHSTPVWSVTWSPDGREVASIGSYGVIKVWDSDRDPESLALRGHRQAVISVAWSPDGSRLASGGEDGAVKLWNATTGRELLTLSGHENWVNSVAWSPSGRHVASGSSDNGVKIWDVATGRQVHSLRGDHGSIHGVAFSPDGKQLAACSRDGTIQVLEDLEDFQKLVTFSAHADSIHSLAWSPDSKLLASGCVDGTIMIWRASDHQAMAKLRAGSGWVSSLSFSPDSTQLASACGHEINIWNVTEGREAVTLRGHTDAATGVSWSPDGLRVASTGSDHSIRIWDPRTGEETLLIPSHASTVFCGVAWSPDSLRLARAGLEVVRIWDATLGYERDHSPRVIPYLDRKIAGGSATAEEIEFRSAILAEQGEWSRAAADWDRVIQLDPESRQPLLATGWWITEANVTPSRPADELSTSLDPRPPLLDPNSPGPSSVWRQATVESDDELRFDVPLPHENTPLGLLRVYSSIGQPVSATFLAPANLELWLNGRQVHQLDKQSSNHKLLKLPVILQKGWNTLAVQLGRSEDQSRLAIRLSTAPADWSRALVDSGRSEEATRLIREGVNHKPNDLLFLRAAARFHRRLGAQLRESKHSDAAQADEREACSLYAKLISQMPYDGALVSEVRDYLRSLNTRPMWTVLMPTTLTSEGGATLVRLADGSILAGGNNSDKDTYTIVATTEMTEISAIRLEVLADASMPRAGPGRHPGGNFHLTAIALSAAPSNAASSSQSFVFGRAIASYTRPPDHDTTVRDGPRGAIDGTHETHWDIWPQVGKTNAAFFETKQPVSGRALKSLTFRLHFRDPVYKQVNLGRFRLAVTNDPYPLAIESWQAAGDLIGLAGAYYAAGDSRRAIELLESNIAPSGGDVQSWLGLALCGAEVGRLPEARVWYDRALAQLREHPTSDDGIKEMVLLAMTKVAGLSRAEAEVKLRSF
jgi:WD40 repeat protein